MGSALPDAGNASTAAEDRYNTNDPVHTTALHEAGHVIAAWALGHYVDKVAIRAELVKLSPVIQGFQEQTWTIGGYVCWDSVNASPKDRMLVALAGDAARALIEPAFHEWDLEAFERRHPLGEHSDLANLREAADELQLSEVERRRLYAELFEECCALLTKHFDVLVSVAKELRDYHLRGRQTDSPASLESLTLGPDPVAIHARRQLPATA